MLLGSPQWGRGGADRRPEGRILLRTQPANPYRVTRDRSLVLARHYQKRSQNSGQPALAAALAHQLAADATSPPACNAFAPTWLLLATVQALPAKLQHAKGVLQLQKTLEHSHPPFSSGPVWATHPAPWLQGGLNLWTQ